MVALCGVSLAAADDAAAPAANAESAPAATAAPTATPAPEKPKPSAYYDLIFFADSRPIFIRVHIEVGERPLAEAWQANVADEFKFLDRDQNGAPGSAELDRAAFTAQRQPSEGTLAQNDRRSAWYRPRRREGGRTHHACLVCRADASEPP